VLCFSLQLLSETFLALGKIQRDAVINVHRSSCKVPVDTVRFSGQIFKKSSNTKFHKHDNAYSRPVQPLMGAENFDKIWSAGWQHETKHAK
jgi:hypothetical protein